MKEHIDARYPFLGAVMRASTEKRWGFSEGSRLFDQKGELRGILWAWVQHGLCSYLGVLKQLCHLEDPQVARELIGGIHFHTIAHIDLH